MPRTHLEQNDGLDALSSEELEERAFGPAPDAPARSALRGAVERPRPVEVVGPSATEREASRANRRLRVAVGLLLAAVVGLSAALVAGVEPEEPFDQNDEGVLVLDGPALVDEGGGVFDGSGPIGDEVLQDEETGELVLLD